MERIWYIFSEGDTTLVSNMMKKFEKAGSIKVPEDLAKKVCYMCTHVFVCLSL